ncbi:MAG: SDR family oxidoreductase, partial [Pseudomonadota bacterium]
FITGAAGAIGRATATLMLREGAALVLCDLDAAALDEAGSEFRGPVLTVAADVTDRTAVDAAMRAAAERFGGIDIVVSNAGAAFAGAIGEIDDAVLRQSFELNFFSHHNVAQAATRVFRLQGTGGCLLFNASKQAVNPGPGFGAYGTAKAATLALARQYALEYGRDGIRSNAVNADRIRSGLLSDEMIRERAAARGISEADYLSGNLLGKEVRAADVARAFLQLALAERTTGATLTVDGGNVAAALR